MKILALDLGTNTGWAVSSKLITSGVENFSAKRFEGGGMRFLRFQRWLTELHSLTGFEVMLFEEVRRHLSTDAGHVYGGFLATLSAWGEQQPVPYQGVPVGTIKKFATGKGNASKDEMMAAARKRGHSPVDDNEADALMLLYWGLDNVAPSTPDSRPTPDGKRIRRKPLENL